MTTTITHSQRQAICTRYVAPTYTRSSRIIATSESGLPSSTFYDYALSSKDNHARACLKLCAQLKWTGPMISGATKTGYAFVFVGEPVRNQED